MIISLEVFDEDVRNLHFNHNIVVMCGEWRWINSKQADSADSECIFLMGLVLFVSLAAILLGSIKVPYAELKRRIVEVDEEQLEVAQVEQLIRYMPEPEQMSQLAALKDEYDTLSEAEQFGVVVC